ncbi:hypothetical protein D5085_13165 [Ectothiorhodospiraceae bacterium BW-2]|nr:hypothetical protein D5085_13165 [Ectothiorhodospiraceae bacterium BW-2]
MQSKLGVEHAIFVVGVLFFVVISVIALIPESFPSPPPEREITATTANEQPASAIAPAATNVNRFLSPQQSQVVPAPQPQGWAAAQLQPTQAVQAQPYHGRIQQLLNMGQNGWGQQHIMVSDGLNGQIEISLAPQWYLQFQGCTLAEGLMVEGEAFNFDTTGATNLLYAKNIIVNGVRCRLRTVDGLALWTDQIG